MGGEDGEMMFKHGDETEVEMTSMPLYAKVDPFFPSADWDPVVSAMGSSSHYTSLVMENSGMSGFAHYQPGSGSSYVDMSTSLLPCGNVSGSNQIGHVLGSDEKGESEGRLRRTGEIHEDHQVSEDGVLGASPCRKRRRPESDLAPSLHWNKKAVEESLKDVETEDQNQKKVESERNMVEDSGGKAPVDKGNYIHVRARRGQATNSHSLAERVRREKISERMRLLQELVPGCNKITGKAVMLDEIINYVQSLQQQVEFLSMKLATVNPELNIDVDRIEQEIILHSRDRNTIMLGLSTGMNHLYQYSTIQGTIPNLLATNPQFNPLPQQTVLDTELQSLYQMGFVSNPTNMESLPPNGAIETGDVMHQR